MLSKLRVLTTVLLVSLSVGLAWGQVTAPKSSLKAKKQAEKKSVVAEPPRSAFSGVFTLSRSTNLYDYKDGTRNDGMDYEFRAGYGLSENYSLGLLTSYSQDLKDSEGSDFSNTSISMRKNPNLVGNFLNMGFGTSIILPTSKKANKLQSMIAGWGVNVAAEVNPDLLASGLKISSSMGITKNFHTYNSALDGTVNNSWSSLQSLGIDYTFKFPITLSFAAVHRNTLSYQDTLKDSFELSEEISYAATANLGISVGHTNAGSSLKPNATDSNVQLTNDRSSLVYASMTLLF